MGASDRKAPSKDPIKDTWATPQFLFDRLNERFCFGLDAAASAENAKCDLFITEEENSLVIDWDRGNGAVWINPPYSKTKEFITRARRQSRTFGRTIVLLIPATTGVAWFHTHVIGTASEVWFFRQRLAFVSPVTRAPVKGSNFESMLVVFSPYREKNTFMGNLSRYGVPLSERSDTMWYGSDFGNYKGRA
jgi:DNA (cytosine-5)-methyltransferase 1